MANDPEGRERAKWRCTEGHESAGVTQEAAQEEVDTARKLAKLVRWVGEKLTAPNPSPPPPPATTETPASASRKSGCHTQLEGQSSP